MTSSSKKQSDGFSSDVDRKIQAAAMKIVAQQHFIRTQYLNVVYRIYKRNPPDEAIIIGYMHRDEFWKARIAMHTTITLADKNEALMRKLGDDFKSIMEETGALSSNKKYFHGNVQLNSNEKVFRNVILNIPYKEFLDAWPAASGQGPPTTIQVIVNNSIIHKYTKKQTCGRIERHIIQE